MTGSELALLTLLAEAPRHGYEIEQVIEARGMREWAEIGFSSIYYVLKKMEARGLVHSELAASSRSAGRKIYHITTAGRDALRAAALEALTIPRAAYVPFQLGLANLPALEPGEAAAALRLYAMALDERAAHVRARRDAQRPLPGHVEAMFDFSLNQIDAERRWIAAFITRLERENGRQA